MRISWIKSKNDKESFKIFKNIGLDVLELEDLEETDKTINELIESHCKTIVLSDEVAANSSDIIKKYRKDENINIIITPRRK